MNLDYFRNKWSEWDNWDRTQRVLIASVVAFIALAVLAPVFAPLFDTPEESAARLKQTADSRRRQERAELCEDLIERASTVIKEKLADPGAFQLRDSGVYQLNGRYRVFLEYRGRNAFNAYVINSKSFYFDEHLRFLGVSEDPLAWDQFKSR